MKKAFNIILIAFFSTFLSLDVNAVAVPNCTYNNPLFNATKFGVPLNAPVDETLIYEITNVSMQDNTLSIFGWAFDSRYDSSLYEGGNSKVWMILYPIEKGWRKDYWNDPEKSYVPMKVTYAQPGIYCDTQGCADGTPKFFDYTFWNCYKSKDSNGAQQCGYNPGQGGNKYGLDSPELQGGFKATIDLKEAYETEKLKKGVDYRVRLLFERKESGYYKDIDAAVFEGLVENEVKNYKGYTSDDDESISIEISGFKKEARMIVGSGLIIGPGGTTCSHQLFEAVYESALKAGRTAIYKKYFKLNEKYLINGNVIRGCRGPSANCTDASHGNGAVNLYGLNIAKSSGTYHLSGSDMIGYAPASWLNFEGTIDIKTKAEEEEDPDICEGDEIYYLYYYFADGVNKTYKGNINYTATYNDAKILEELEFETNSDMTVEGGPLSSKTVKNNFDTYYNNFWSAIESGQNYIEQDGKYYLIPTEGFHKWPGGSSYTFATEKGYDQNSLTKHAQSAFKRGPASGGLGYQYIVNDSVDYTDSKNAPKSIKQGTKATDLHDMYKLFTVYQLTVCRTEEPEPEQCEDTVTQAVCNTGDTGTHVVYHENPNIKDCTLEKGTHSGFTIVEKEETKPPIGNSFGTVACKEDLDFYLPGGKQTASGQYFLLDNYIPKVEALRTCATSPVKYDDLVSNLEDNYEPEAILPMLYNKYRDTLYTWKNLKQPVDNSGPKTGSCDDPDKPIYAEDGSGEIVGYEKYEYEIDQYKMEAVHGAPNEGKTGIYFPESPGHYIANPGPCNVDVGKTRAEFFKEKKDEWEAKTWGAKGAYDGKLEAYHNTVIAYNTMFRWTETVNDTVFHASGSIEEAAYISSGSGSEDTTYKFKPYVTFYYGLPNQPEPDGKVFPITPLPYEYSYKQQSPGENKDYWGKGVEPDSKYENGGGGRTTEVRPLMNCKDGGETCTTGTKTVPITFITNGAVRRDEDIDYEYNLPTISTTIPDGRVFGPGNSGSKPSNKTAITLPAESVPVNINTLAGQYTYSITFEHYKDRLRKEKFPKNQDDDWADNDVGNDYKLEESRVTQRKVFNGSNYGYAEHVYACTYDVINDIYLPGPQKFNFFYRVVDTLNINPLGRELGYNWTDARAEEVKATIKEDALSTTTLYEAHEKFVFVLDAYTMATIRSYNAKQDDGYSDWDLTCSDYDQTGSRAGYHCYSNFLNCLVDPGSGDRCSEIVPATHTNCLGNDCYTKDHLDNNRSALIIKQNALDGKGG